MHRQTSSEIYKVAADWAARVDRGALSEGEQADLMVWRRADRRHDGAYVRAEAVLGRFDRAKALGVDYDARSFYSQSPMTLSRRTILWLGGAAVAAGVAVAAVGLDHTGQYTSSLGEVRLVALPDGSVMTLNSASKVRVKFTPRARSVEMVNGEALFDVAKNPARPFVVTMGDTRVQGFECSFSAKHIANQPVEVLVRQGMVDVSREKISLLGVEDDRASTVRLTANQKTIAGAGVAPSVVALSPTNLHDALAWKDGMIAFRQTPLRVAAEEYARYSATPLVVDPLVANQTVTGLFSAYNPVGFAQAAAGSLDLHAHVADGSVYLTQ